MKKLTLCVIGMLVFSMAAGTMVTANLEKKPIIENTSTSDYSHTIFAEFCTATWCGYCRYAHGALKNIYAGGWHPFYYISLVDDENMNAEDRINEYGVSGFPTVFFDGGYESVVGAGSIESAQAAYNASIVDCGEAEVADIDIDLDVTWNGNAEMDISVTVDNNEDSLYEGHLHVYVNEIISSMGWYDTGGYLYTFPFLDYAFNEDISISAGGTWQDSVNWDGNDYNDGYGDDFGGITYGNIMIIATVFADDTEYADDTTGFRVGDNDDPNTPSNPDPEDDDTDVIVETPLSWDCDDPDDDVLCYDVYLGKYSNPSLAESDHLGTTYYPPDFLDFDETYYWKIVAKDPLGGSTSGPVWSFTTRDNSAPYIPSDPDPGDGATNVYINSDLSWTGGDPDDDEVTYDVYLDTDCPPTTKVKSNQSGTTYNPPGVLDFDTTYCWKIVAWDKYGYSSVGPVWSFTTEENQPPYPPSDPDPSDGATDVSIEDMLWWTGEDPNPGDKLTYDIYFGKSSTPPLIYEDLTQAVYDPGTMDLETTYYWQIIVYDSQGLSEVGDIWQFTTESYNEPPNAPNIQGETNGKHGEEYEYTFSATDPQGDDVYFWIEWGDGDVVEWYGPYNSDEEFTLSHSWTEKGGYTIRVKAKDMKESVSEWATLEVTMPKNKAFIFNFPLLSWLFEQFPNAFPFLRQILSL